MKLNHLGVNLIRNVQNYTKKTEPFLKVTNVVVNQ